ncbi:MAG: DUF47 domain-containing protein [Verrucomicrobiales bacterium]
MFSLQRLLGRPKEFFSLLEQSAELGCQAATALNEMVTHPNTAPSLDIFAQARRKDKEIINRLEEMLSVVFVTPFEREDLEDVAQGLYRIPKAVEKFAERYVITWEKVRDVDFTLAARMLERATVVIRDMVRSLRNFGTLADIKSFDARLSQIEADAAHILMDATRRIYAPGTGSLKAIIVKELFDVLSEGIDDCRDLGRTLALVVLRNS